VESIRFEPGSQLRRLEENTFALCHSLVSICIAASVEFLAKNCFVESKPQASSASVLRSVTFEPGSKLREIEQGAFCCCSHLHKIVIPASVEKMSSESLPDRRYGCRIEIEEGNVHFAQRARFLIDLDHNWILRYLGGGSEVEIPDEIEKIDGGGFLDCSSLSSVTFGSSSKLSSIEANGFLLCNHLKMIQIPSSVTFLGCFCFGQCSHLHVVSFCSGSQLQCISDGAFRECPWLESIVLPSTVKVIGAACFERCWQLKNSPIPVDSEIIRIGERAFASCSSLTSFILPSSVEFVGDSCFRGCRLYRSFAFGSPSHLRELLDVPDPFSGSLSIPDSVEVLSLPPCFGLWQATVFVFGAESRLSEVRLRSLPTSLPRPIVCRSFLKVSIGSLKRFRKNLEFETSK
jgi:hypothetical protein